MTSDRIYLDYLKDILTEIDRVSRFIRGMNYERFSRDEKTQYVNVNLEVVWLTATQDLPRLKGSVKQAIQGWR